MYILTRSWKTKSWNPLLALGQRAPGRGFISSHYIISRNAMNHTQIAYFRRGTFIIPKLNFMKRAYLVVIQIKDMKVVIVPANDST